ncbi:PREDICTED: Retrovirus-related Pol poly from transposon [Prunus dulcis]|nr:PREDICTED: Retrovirus-related Pol poly from transposon [Prunus dulcis]
MAWLLTVITQALANRIIYVDTPTEVWSDLQDRFSIRKTIAENKQGQQIVCQYYTKLKSLWDELGFYQLYHTTPVELKVLRKAYSMIMKEDQQREVGEHTSSDVAHAMNVSNKMYKPPGSSSSRATPKYKRPTVPNKLLKKVTHADLSFAPIVRIPPIWLIDVSSYMAFRMGTKFMANMLSYPINQRNHPRQIKHHPPLHAKEGFKFFAEEYAKLKSLLCDGKPRANLIDMKRTCRGITEAASSLLDRERRIATSRRQRLDMLASQEDQRKHGPQHPSEDTIEVQGVAASHVFGTGLANVRRPCN